MQISEFLSLGFDNSELKGDHYSLTLKNKVVKTENSDTIVQEVFEFISKRKTTFRAGPKTFEAMAKVINDFGKKGHTVLVSSDGIKITITVADNLVIRLSKDTAQILSQLFQSSIEYPDTYFPRSDLEVDSDVSGEA